MLNILVDTQLCGAVYTVYEGVLKYVTPAWADFSMVDISTAVGIVLTVPVSNRLALETCRRELSEDVSFGV